MFSEFVEIEFTALPHRLLQAQAGNSTRYRRQFACSILWITKVESVGFP